MEHLTLLSKVQKMIQDEAQSQSADVDGVDDDEV